MVCNLDLAVIGIEVGRETSGLDVLDFVEEIISKYIGDFQGEILL